MPFEIRPGGSWISAPSHPRIRPDAGPSAEGPSAFAGAWVDVTADTIGETTDWTNKVELADIDADGFVDLLFANGGDYDTPGTPVASRAFLNNGDGTFTDATEAVLGNLELLTATDRLRSGRSRLGARRAPRPPGGPWGARQPASSG